MQVFTSLNINVCIKKKKKKKKTGMKKKERDGHDDNDNGDNMTNRENLSGTKDTSLKFLTYSPKQVYFLSLALL